jgi:hypothetical protein
MAKQTKSTQQSAKPKKPLVNWFSRTKEKSSVKDSIAPDSSVISYTKKKVTAPASVLGGGKMTKENKLVEREKKSGYDDRDVAGEYGYLLSSKKSKEGQKSKSHSESFIKKGYTSPKDSLSTTYKVYKLEDKSFRKPTKLLKGVEKSYKDSSMKTETIKYDKPEVKWQNQKDYDFTNPSGKTETSKKVLSLPKSTAKNMKDSFDNMKSAPEYIVKKSKKSSQKY